MRRGIVQAAEVVACTLSSAGGDLLSLVMDTSNGTAAGAASAPGPRQHMLFDVLIIDEVRRALACVLLRVLKISTNCLLDAP